MTELFTLVLLSLALSCAPMYVTSRVLNRYENKYNEKKEAERFSYQCLRNTDPETFGNKNSESS